MDEIWHKIYHLDTKIFLIEPGPCRGLKDTSQKADLERDYTKLHPCYINRKGGAKGLDWCCIGENWRKLAEVG